MEAIAGQFPAPEIASFTFFSLLAAEGARAQVALLLEHVILYHPLVPDGRLLRSLEQSTSVIRQASFPKPGGSRRAACSTPPGCGCARHRTRCQVNRSKRLKVNLHLVHLNFSSFFSSSGAPSLSTGQTYEMQKNSVFADESFFSCSILENTNLKGELATIFGLDLAIPIFLGKIPRVYLL